LRIHSSGDGRTLHFGHQAGWSSREHRSSLIDALTTIGAGQSSNAAKGRLDEGSHGRLARDMRDAQRLLEHLDDGTEACHDVRVTAEAMRAVYRLLTDGFAQPIDEPTLNHIRRLIAAARVTLGNQQPV